MALLLIYLYYITILIETKKEYFIVKLLATASLFHNEFGGVTKTF